MDSYRDPASIIRVETGKAFAIELRGNPTTGYTWCADPTPPCIRLAEQDFLIGGTGIGSGGLEVFHFEAQEPGTAQIVFHYRRAWGGPPRETIDFQVVVT
ncbi:protease inhibitor I42 family protein [Chloroflexota bacterium]